MSDTVERSVHFFSTRLVDVQTGHLVSDQTEVWRALAVMPWEGQNGAPGRCRNIADGVDEALDILNTPSQVVEGRIYKTKRKGHPLVGVKQADAPLRFNNPEAGLRYATHFVWWDISQMPDEFGAPAPVEGLLAVEFNMEGPRPKRIGAYVGEVFRGKYHLEVTPVIDKHSWEKLKGTDYQVKTMTARIPLAPSDIPVGDAAGLDVPARLGEIGRFEWTVSAERGSLIDLKPALDRIRGLVRDREELELHVKLDGGDTLPLDEYHVRKRVSPVRFEDGTKCVDQSSMLKEIHDAADLLGPSLARSLGRTWQLPTRLERNAAAG